ncbi:MAG: hypothetical protein ACXWFS_11775 [Thermoanaerobaculia bacterium]
MKTRRRAALALVPLVLASCVRVRHVPALPEEAFAARLSLLSPPASVAPLARFTVPLLVENSSPVAWPRMGWGSRGRILSASYHWKAEDGSMTVHDGLRTPLRTALGPGERARVSLSVAAPVHPGAYVLEADLVQEGVAWFSDHGSPVARAAVRVEGQGVTP